MMLNLSGYGTLPSIQHFTVLDHSLMRVYIYIRIRVILKLLLILAADPHMCCILIVANPASSASSSVINLILFNIMTQNLQEIRRIILRNSKQILIYYNILIILINLYYILINNYIIK